jgi:glycosyltransferase involved in cell wall biosynthesis/GT2 family glycosyltransferase
VHPAPPLVSVILAAHDAERFLRPALQSVLRQTLQDLELLVVDDGSTDATPDVLASFDDPRLVVHRNDERLGLAASLNLALDRARGRYVARLDADDIGLPQRLERQVARIRSTPRPVILGTSVCAVDDVGRPGTVHAMPATPLAVRWHLLFSSPFFHPTVLLDRAVLEREALRYDPRFLESEDYDLWTRLLTIGDGANLVEPLVLYRVHPHQASQRRRDLQRSFQLEIARREIARVAPELTHEEAELAWSIGAGEDVDPERLEDAARAYLELARSFQSRLSFSGGSLGGAVARPLARAALRSRGRLRARVLRQALELDPLLPVHAASVRAARRSRERAARRDAQAWLEELDVSRPVGPDRPKTPPRVAAIFPEPTPYRAPLLDTVADRPDLDLTVLYAAQTVAGRTWHVEPRHRAVYLRGIKVPGAERVLRHDYPVTPGVLTWLRRARPDVVVVSGWSTFAAQAAIAWSRRNRVPYVLVVESHDEDPRPGWRRTIKGTVVPPIVRGASSVLVTGTVAKRSMVARGASPQRVRVFANTVDVDAFGERADRLAARRPELRAELGAGTEDVVVLSVGRLVQDKGMDVLIRAVAAAGNPRLVLALAGDGPARSRLEGLAAEVGVRLVLAGDRPWERIIELYVAADVFALLSEREPWGVVVNEAAACGLPLVLSDRVGAAHDLLHDGENGILVPVGDIGAAADALRRLAEDPDLRRTFGLRSREIAAEWGYAPSAENFLTAVREAAA